MPLAFMNASKSSSDKSNKFSIASASKNQLYEYVSVPPVSVIYINPLDAL